MGEEMITQFIIFGFIMFLTVICNVSYIEHLIKKHQKQYHNKQFETFEAERLDNISKIEKHRDEIRKLEKNKAII